MTTSLSFAVTLSDASLLAHVDALVQRERHATADLIGALAELDTRRLYLGTGCSSLFTYCTQVLHLSEHAAYGRIEAARAARRFPIVLEHLAGGTLTLTAVCLLAPVLTDENHQHLIEESRHKSKREVELLVASTRPMPSVPSTVRKLPQPKAASHVETTRPAGPVQAAASSISPEAVESDGRSLSPGVMTMMRPAPPTVIRPLAPERYKVQFTLSGEAHEKLRRVQDLLRHSIPDGDPAAIFERALTLLLNNLEMQKLAAVARPRPARSARSGSERSRHVPSAVRRAVWARDEGRCAFVGTNGRCGERGFLEFHHVVPFADGGGSTVENLQLRCAAHNAYEAKLYFELSVVREAKATYGSARSGPSPSGPSFFCQQGATGCVSASLGVVITAPHPFLAISDATRAAQFSNSAPRVAARRRAMKCSCFLGDPRGATNEWTYRVLANTFSTARACS